MPGYYRDVYVATFLYSSGLVARPQAVCFEGMGLIPIQMARVFVGVSSLNPLVWAAA